MKALRVVLLIAAVIAVLALSSCGQCKHANIDKLTVSEASCAGDGIIQSVCRDCGEIVKIDKIAKLPHTEEIVEAVEPTCSNMGSTEGKRCATCGAVLLDRTPIDKLPHTYSGTGDTDCDVCGETRDDGCIHAGIDIIPAKAATCSETGLTAGASCAGCGGIIIPQQELPKIAHTYDDQNDGKCNQCGYNRDTTCSHFETQTVGGRSATCILSGLAAGINCKDCGEILVSQDVIPALGHEWGSIIPEVPAGFNKSGTKAHYECTRCDALSLDAENLCSKGDLVIPAAIEGGDLTASEGLGFVSYDDYTCYVSGIGSCLDNNIVIPSVSPDGKTVIAIDSYAFEYNENIKSVVIPDTVTRIGYGAFYVCKNLESVVIPESVTYIEYNAFLYCDNLTDLYYNGTLDQWAKIWDGRSGDRIGTDPATLAERFYLDGELITELVIPATWSYIPDYAFYGYHFTGVILLDGLTNIGAYAFAECDNLTDITIPDSVTNIGDSAFYHSGLESIVIPDSVTRIGDGVFGQCENLASVTISSNVTRIDRYAFSGCVSLKSVVIPNSVISIGEYAFSDCSALESITIPDGVVSIEKYAFAGCESLKSATIPNSVTAISEGVFYSCTALRSVSLPDSATYIGREAFRGCASLLTISIPDSVIAIEGYTFYDCISLKSLEVADNAQLLRIGNNAFYNCKSLSSVKFGENSKLGGIGEYAFCECLSLTNVVLPDSLTDIGSYAFQGCKSITKIVIPAGVSEIGECAFSGCSSLAQAVISNSVRLKNGVFSGCISLASVVLPVDVYIGWGAFNGCTSLAVIKYCGTQEQWNEVYKESSWDSGTNYYTVTYNYTAE